MTLELRAVRIFDRQDAAPPGFRQDPDGRGYMKLPEAAEEESEAASGPPDGWVAHKDGGYVRAGSEVPVRA